MVKASPVESLSGDIEDVTKVKVPLFKETLSLSLSVSLFQKRGVYTGSPSARTCCSIYGALLQKMMLDSQSHPVIDIDHAKQETQVDPVSTSLIK